MLENKGGILGGGVLSIWGKGDSGVTNQIVVLTLDGLVLNLSNGVQELTIDGYTATIDTADLADGPIFFKPPSFTHDGAGGDPVSGDTVTMDKGIVLFRAGVANQVAMTFEVYRNGVIATDATIDPNVRTYVVQPTDASVGLDIRVTAYDENGSRSSDVAVLAGLGYTPTEVFIEALTNAGADKELEWTGDLSATAYDYLLVFAAYDAGGTAQFTKTAGSGGSNGSAQLAAEMNSNLERTDASNGTSFDSSLTDGGVFQPEATMFVAGPTSDVLYRYTVSNGWESVTDPQPASPSFLGSPGFQFDNVILRKLAVWGLDVIPDFSTAFNQSLLIQPNGDPQHPDLYNTATGLNLGTPLIEFDQATATEWETGVHSGSLATASTLSLKATPVEDVPGSVREWVKPGAAGFVYSAIGSGKNSSNRRRYGGMLTCTLKLTGGGTIQFIEWADRDPAFKIVSDGTNGYIEASLLRDVGDPWTFTSATDTFEIGEVYHVILHLREVNSGDAEIAAWICREGSTWETIIPVTTVADATAFPTGLPDLDETNGNVVFRSHSNVEYGRLRLYNHPTAEMQQTAFREQFYTPGELPKTGFLNAFGVPAWETLWLGRHVYRTANFYNLNTGITTGEMVDLAGDDTITNMIYDAGTGGVYIRAGLETCFTSATRAINTNDDISLIGDEIGLIENLADPTTSASEVKQATTAHKPNLVYVSQGVSSIEFATSNHLESSFDLGDATRWTLAMSFIPDGRDWQVLTANTDSASWVLRGESGNAATTHGGNVTINAVWIDGVPYTLTDQAALFTASQSATTIMVDFTTTTGWAGEGFKIGDSGAGTHFAPGDVCAMVMVPGELSAADRATVEAKLLALAGG